MTFSSSRALGALALRWRLRRLQRGPRRAGQKRASRRHRGSSEEEEGSGPLLPVGKSLLSGKDLETASINPRQAGTHGACRSPSAPRGRSSLRPRPASLETDRRRAGQRRDLGPRGPGPHFRRRGPDHGTLHEASRLAIMLKGRCAARGGGIAEDRSVGPGTGRTPVRRGCRPGLFGAAMVLCSCSSTRFRGWLPTWRW